MTTTEPTPEAVEELARVIDPAGWNAAFGDNPAAQETWRIAARKGARRVLAAGYVLDGSVLVLREQVRKQGVEVERLTREAEKAKEREIAARAKGLKYHGETEQVRRLAEDVLTMLGPA